MMVKRRVFVLMCCAVAGLLAGCGGGGTEPGADAGQDARVAAAVQQTLEALSVAQTVAAAGGQAAASPTTSVATPTIAVVEAAPTEAPVVPPTSTVAAATAAPVEPDAPPVTGTCTVLTGLNLRPGPGTAYNPPLAALGANTRLVPLAYSPTGNPGGQWLQVRLDATNQIGWVSAGAQYVACDVSFASLPATTNLPPVPVAATREVPTATVAPTATVVVAKLPILENDPGSGSNYPEEDVIVNVSTGSDFLYRLDIDDADPGDEYEAAIREVRFLISGTTADGDFIQYTHDEQTEGYCALGGGEPICKTWPLDEQGFAVWPGTNTRVEAGNYNATIEVYPENEHPDFFSPWSWFIPFSLSMP
jgi:hypothetical protein